MAQKDFTTLALTKVALKISDDGDDALITPLILLVTGVMTDIMDRPGFFENGSDVVEFPDVVAPRTTVLFVNRYPGTDVTSMHESEDVPRTYTSATQLVEDTDFIVDADQGIIHRLNGYWSSEVRAVRINYDGGYADETTVPRSLVTAAHMIISAVLQKQKSRMYHLTKSEVGEGLIEGIRREDIPDTAREILGTHRRKLV